MVGQLLLNLLQGDPLQQAFQGGQPAPQGGAPGLGGPSTVPGASPGPGGPPPPQQMAPAQATQSPADLQRLYIQLLQRNRSADEIDRGLTNIVAAFSPPAAQASVMANMPRGTNTGDELSNLMELQKYGMGQQALAQMLTPEFMKAAQDNYGMSPSEVKAMVLGGNMPQFMTKVIEARTGVNEDLDTRQYLQYQRETLAKGEKPMSIADWKTQHAATATTATTQAKDVTEFKDNAKEDYQTAIQKTTPNIQTVDQLLGNMDATMEALTTLKPTSGLAAANLPGWLTASQDAKNQAAALNTLKGGLSADVMGGMKNIRNQNEFKSVTSSQTGAFDPANSKEKVRTALENIRNKLLNAQATATAAAGYKLTGDLVGKGDRSLLDSNDRYYNGATEEEGAAPSQGVGAKPLDDTAKAKAQDLIKQHGRDYVIKYLTDNGYDTSGL